MDLQLSGTTFYRGNRFVVEDLSNLLHSCLFAECRRDGLSAFELLDGSSIISGSAIPADPLFIKKESYVLICT